MIPNLRPPEPDFSSLFLWIVLDWQVLATNHTVSLEPFTTELLGSTIWSVGPFDSDTVVVGVLKWDSSLLCSRSFGYPVLTSCPKAKASQETARRTASFGSRTPHGGSTPSLFMLVVLIPYPIRRADELITLMWKLEKRRREETCRSTDSSYFVQVLLLLFLLLKGPKLLILFSLFSVLTANTFIIEHQKTKTSTILNEAENQITEMDMCKRHRL
ncbi:hypothetical protein GCK72_010756 [Caenorhabditis remanei]|uniref:Uncharacterized protein n=1 Tax=Caenorhabditis remanei TaxID=31234 RepID=A0A6A5H6U5_CAERE|nr:hypothetical protein GCK72_010756 [Caenorhabditis remanei]KAF1762494.1 hypothetical protein GCK72_010756 [Caenorhabditis remanei]